MPISLILAATLQPTLPQSAPVAARPAAYVIHGDYGVSPRQGNLRRLLGQWTDEGAARMRPSRRPAPDIAPCLSGLQGRTVDHACIQRLYPQRPGEPPTVTIVARDSGRRHPVLNVYCYGPDGVGAATGGVNMNHGGAFSSLPRERSEIRVRLAGCIDTALRGSVVRSAAAMRGFDDFGIGEGDFFYHRLTGDCAEIMHRIGRNATRGDFRMSLARVRWSIEPGARRRVRIDCEEGACVRSLRGAVEQRAAEHRIAFPDEAGATSFVRRLDSLKRACRR